jgi:hypothetical protein
MQSAHRVRTQPRLRVTDARALGVGWCGHMRACPRCFRHNADDAQSCDCGLDLATARVRARPGLRLSGGLLCVVGVALVAFGSFGGMALLPVRLNVFLTVRGHRIDLALVAAGVAAILIGLRRLDRGDDGLRGR